MRMVRYSLSATYSRVGIFVLSLALSACASSAPPKVESAQSTAPAGPVPTSPVPKPTAARTGGMHSGFVGYRWTVTAISKGGPDVAVPARYAVFLSFYRDGMFVGNEPVNTHPGSYRVTDDGFITGDVGTSDVLGGAKDAASELAIEAMLAFTMHPGTHAVVEVSGQRMTVRENGFTLRCVQAAKATAPDPHSPW
jgi:hypothetical protein